MDEASPVYLSGGFLGGLFILVCLPLTLKSNVLLTPDLAVFNVHCSVCVCTQTPPKRWCLEKKCVARRDSLDVAQCVEGLPGVILSGVWRRV